MGLIQSVSAELTKMRINMTNTKKQTRMVELKQLLTWYGITDIRSAMGFEHQGPILGALKTGNFKDVHILAYTKKRIFTAEEIAEQTQIVDELNCLKNKNSLSKEESWKYVDALANTPIGHKFYEKWLKQQLAELKINVNIVVHECFLSELNDTEGIYFSAVEALTAATKHQNSEITFFLSPGTPVMAFSWALAMLAFPKHNIKLLASPDFRKGVNSIEIPDTILTHIRQNQESGEK